MTTYTAALRCAIRVCPAMQTVTYTVRGGWREIEATVWHCSRCEEKS